MKKIFFCIVMMLCSWLTWGQASYSKVDGNTFKAEKVTKEKAKATYTKAIGKYYIDTDSVKYEIYTHTVTKGKEAGQTFCYIQKVSKKTGKPYWKRIDVKPEELGN